MISGFSQESVSLPPEILLHWAKADNIQSLVDMGTMGDIPGNFDLVELCIFHEFEGDVGVMTINIKGTSTTSSDASRLLIKVLEISKPDASVGPSLFRISKSDES